MFGVNYAGLVKRGKWEKLNTIMEKGNEKANIAIAKACGESDTDESRNMLVRLINENSRGVKLAAIEAMMKVGSSVSMSHIRRVQAACDKNDTEMVDALAAAVNGITERSKN